MLCWWIRRGDSVLQQCRELRPGELWGCYLWIICYHFDKEPCRFIWWSFQSSDRIILAANWCAIYGWVNTLRRANWAFRLDMQLWIPGQVSGNWLSIWSDYCDTRYSIRPIRCHVLTTLRLLHFSCNHRHLWVNRVLCQSSQFREWLGMCYLQSCNTALCTRIVFQWCAYRRSFWYWRSIWWRYRASLVCSSRHQDFDRVLIQAPKYLWRW